MPDGSRSQMDDTELSAILDAEQQQAISFSSGELSKEREEALKGYYGEPDGHEEEGYSQIVTREIMDTVEWVLPALLEIFMGGEAVVEFNPRGPEDEEAAKQRTDYVNYIFQQDNPGFKVLYTAFKDALIQKNGVVKVYYDERALDETRTLTGIDDDAYTDLVNDPDVEIVEHSEYQDETGPAESIGPSAAGAGGAMPPGAVPPAAMQGMPPMPPNGALGGGSMPMGMPPAMMAGPGGGTPPIGAGAALPLGAELPPAPPALLHDVKYTKRAGKVCCEPIAPEEWLISRRARDIKNAPYVADRRRKRLSDLIAEGLLTEEEALALGGDDPTDLTGEAVARSSIDDEGQPELSDREGVMREVWVTDHYILVDADQDGVAERLRVITAGSTANVILREEWEGPPPYASGSPILVTHRVIGQSLADQVKDLQLITTSVTRQVLNNLYRTNIPRHFIRDGVNVDDYLNPQPGGYVRVDGNPSEYVKDATIPFTAGASLPILEYLQTVRENRTGVTRYNQGIDANSLNKTATGITQIMTAAQQRIKLIARILAETFVKDLFALIDHCATKYQNKARVIRIRNKWVSVDPRQWESNFDMTVNVGLGTGNKDMQLQHLQMILAMQAQVIQLQGGVQGPLVTLENVHHGLTKLTENAGFKNADAFWTDPAQAQQMPQEPKPDPEMAKVEQQGKIEAAKLELQAKNDEARLELDAKKSQAEMILKFAEANANLELRKTETQQNAAMNREKMTAEHGMARERMNGEMKLGKKTALAKAKAEGIPMEDDDPPEAVQDLAKDTVEMMMAFLKQQQQRDARQDAELQALKQMITAPKELIRGPDGRVTGARTVMPGNGSMQ